MKKSSSILIILFGLFSFSFGHEYINTQIDGKNVQLLQVDLSSEYKVVTSLSQDGDSLETLVDNVGGVSGVNGVYFCPDDYSECDGNYTHTYRVYEGQHESKYGEDLGARGLFGFDDNGLPLMILNNYGYVDGIDRNFNENKFEKLQYGLANYPVLMLNGENVVNESKDIMDDKMTTPGTKSFICSTNNQEEVIMGTVSDVNIEGLADFVDESLGCYDAINLDAGGSLGMMYENDKKMSPGREIMDAFVVVKKEDYDPAQIQDSSQNQQQDMGNYTIRGDDLYYNQQKVYDVDLDSFEYLGEGYGKDDSYVYYEGEALTIQWGEDPQNVQPGYSVEWADASTFEKIGDGYFKDKNYIYKNGEALKGEELEDYKDIQESQETSTSLTQQQIQTARGFMRKLDSIIDGKAATNPEKRKLYRQVSSKIHNATQDYDKSDRVMFDYIRYLCYQRYNRL
ncbi:phosphodiester glycosidase family protein [Candidatus Absconditicoccus praedator]|uniref:phosphodiester glycosidase family protein n=1 Tax=Candidatus Absconditicoccus praedator TaxID=2735562 RepID=UPI001E46ED0A|nr:phosphodiester glycosidase family protein [Candidatus Absconditicoccus praedator]UFX83115.1 phosphodiester glycosidase family protein [Candidatus Absconditicoccus praedator]